MLRRTRLLCSVLFIVLACAKKVRTENNSGYMPAAISQDASPAVTRVATRPDGGTVLGKGKPLDPEEAERRKLHNTVQAIVFGESVAGISMQTTALEARSILAPATIASQGFEFYPEHIRIAWKAGDSSTPEYLVVDEGYAGKLQMPAPYGALQVGQSMANLLSSESELKSFLLNAGILFEKQSADYNCEKSLTCRMTQDANFFSLEYRRGGLLISNNPSRTLSFIYFNGPNKFYPRPTDPIVYGISVAGITFQSNRVSVEARIGPPEAMSGNFLYYDQASVGVIWGSDGTPAVLQALGSYQGSLNFGSTIGAHKIKDSFASYAPANDDGTLLMQEIYRGLKNTDLDCKTQAVPCTLTIDAARNRITITMDRSAFVFTNTADRTWLLYGSQEP